MLNAMPDLSQCIVTFKSSYFPQVFHDVEAAEGRHTKLWVCQAPLEMSSISGGDP